MRSLRLGLLSLTALSAPAMAQTATPSIQTLEQQIQQLQADAARRDAELKQAQQDLAKLQAQAAQSATTVAAAEAPAKASILPALPDDGSLTFHGVTLYGTVDVGVAYMNHGASVSSYFGPGLPYVVQKNSNRAITTVAQNGLSQSKIGLMGTEALTDDISAVFKADTGFNPLSGNLYDGPRSLVINNGRAANAQTTSGDSSRAGQAFNGVAYGGISSKTYGTLTFGRQNSLILDDIAKYDPQLQSNAFSPLGYSGVAGGGGDTQDARLDRTLRYALTYGPAHLSVQHQFGSTGTVESGDDQVDIGGDYAGFSLDAVYSHVDAAVSAASLSAAQAAVEPVDTLAATVSDNTTYSFQGKYVYGPAKIYGGYEHIKFENPSHPLAAGVTDIGGYLLSVVSDTAYTHHRVLEISWVGLRYSVLTDLDLVGAYYRYDQNSYKGNGCSNSSASSCRGSENFFSFSADYRFTKRLDVYAGAMYSHVLGGLANGYLKTEAIDPMAGVRFNF